MIPSREFWPHFAIVAVMLAILVLVEVVRCAP
jgi:hypothetical protein